MTGVSAESTGLDLSRLENVRQQGDKLEARCPACAELGHDRSGNHLIIYANQKFGCAAFPGDHEHRQRIWALSGGSLLEDRVLLPQLSPKKREEPPLKVHCWPELETGTLQDLRHLSRLREINIEGLELAVQRGILRFFDDRTNGRCWSTLDASRYVRQDRRLDGSPFQLAGGSTAKSRTLGRGNWPIGITQSIDADVVLLTEGGPDLLVATSLIWTETREDDSAAVAMLGAGQRINERALPLFRGKHVRIFPDADEPGSHAAVRWQDQLKSVTDTVDIYALRGLRRNNGEPVKDLCDFLDVSVDIWERDPEVRTVIPYPTGGAI